MGRSYTVPMCVYVDRGAGTPVTQYLGEFRKQYSGKPDADGLRRHVAAYVDSMAPGGVNAALAGMQPLPTRARLVFQTGKRSGEEIAITL
jgi:hypothetical protein